MVKTGRAVGGNRRIRLCNDCQEQDTKAAALDAYATQAKARFEALPAAQQAHITYSRRRVEQATRREHALTRQERI